MRALRVALTVTFLFYPACGGGNIAQTDTPPRATPNPRVAQDRALREQFEYLEFLPAVNERLKGTGIGPLRFQELAPASREVRVWAGFDPQPLVGIILKQVNGEWSARYILPASTPATYRDLIRPLPPPKSGWSSLWEKLEGLDIYTLPDAAEIGALNVYPDATVVVVEIKTPDSYRNYMYTGLDTAAAPEAKKVWEITKTISEEFGISLNGDRS